MFLKSVPFQKSGHGALAYFSDKKMSGHNFYVELILQIKCTVPLATKNKVHKGILK